MVKPNEEHLTPAEAKEYKTASADAQYYEKKLREAQRTVRRIKDVARKRAAK